MPAKKADGESCTCTRLKRASKRSGGCARSAATDRPRDQGPAGWTSSGNRCTRPGEGIAALEEALELLAGVVVEQDGLGPALARPSASP